MLTSKIKVLAFAGIISGALLTAQDNVGIGTNTPDPSAVLDISANDKGVLVPRLTTAQRNAIVTPANGLLVYDTDIQCFHFYDGIGGIWENLCNAAIGADGLSCWDTNGDGIQDAGEDVNSDGSWDYLDCIGADGADGTDGADGADGLACWDINGDGIQDAAEDINSDGNWDYLDCEGPTGSGLACWDTNGDGIQDAGEDTNSDGLWNSSDCGGTGQDGLSCWDLNNDGIADPAEDVNSDGSWDYLDCIGATGPAGANGLACWDINGDGVQDVAEDINSDGNWDYLDCIGATGPAGANGLACWDTNGDGVQDPGEDTNSDGFWDKLDCAGADGAAGAAGTNGTDGTDGVACWDTNGDGVQDLGEDTNSDGFWNNLDCQGPTWDLTTLDFNTDGTLSISTDQPSTVTSTVGAWRTLGNTGTVAATNFIGTTDAIDFVTRTTNLERMRVLAGGQVSVNNATPFAGDVFTVVEQAAGDYGIASYVTTGVGVYGIGTTGDGTYGISSAGGIGVYGYSDGGTASIFGQSTGTTDAVRGNVTAAGSSLWFPVWGVSAATDGIGVVGTGNAITLTLFPPAGAGGVFNGEDWGVYGYAQGALSTIVTSAGGYFQDSVNAVSETYAYVAAFDAGTEYKILGPGAVSTIVDGNSSNDKRIMYAPEAPEVLFEDYGTGQLINGYANIQLDEIFSKNITVNAKHPLRVFIQLEGDSQGTYVFNKSANQFEVKELNNGKSNVSFTYHVIGNRSDAYKDGQLRSKFEDLRFPSAPGEVEHSGKSSKPDPNVKLKQSAKK